MNATSTTVGDSRNQGVHVSDLQSGRPGSRAFAVPSKSPRFRRPTDAVLLTLSVVAIAVTSAQVGDPGDLETAFVGWLTALPGFFDVVWAAAFDFMQIWVVVIGVLALTRRQWALLRDLVASLAITVAGVALVGRIVDGAIPDLLDNWLTTLA